MHVWDQTRKGTGCNIQQNCTNIVLWLISGNQLRYLKIIIFFFLMTFILIHYCIINDRCHFLTCILHHKINMLKMLIFYLALLHHISWNYYLNYLPAITLYVYFGGGYTAITHKAIIITLEAYGNMVSHWGTELDSALHYTIRSQYTLGNGVTT